MGVGGRDKVFMSLDHRDRRSDGSQNLGLNLGLVFYLPCELRDSHNLCPYFTVQFSRSVMSSSLWSHGLQHARLPCPSPAPGACSCPSSWWCHPTISSYVCSLLLLPSISSSIRVFSSSSYWLAKVLELRLQHQFFQWIFKTDFLLDWLVWFPCSSRFSRAFSNTTVQKHQFFSAQLSLWPNSHIHTRLLEENGYM